MKHTFVIVKTTEKSLLVKISRKSGNLKHFYHFILDLVWPIHIALERDGVKKDELTKIVTNDSEAMYFVDYMLEIFGVRPQNSRLNVFLAKLTHFGKSLHKLVGLNSKRRDYFKVVRDPAELRAIHNQFQNFVVGENITTDKRVHVILIERQLSQNNAGSKRRSISNHMELQKRLEDHCKLKNLEFHNVELSKFTFKDQMSLFTNTNVTIIGQHGAGLIHLLWMNRSFGKVIELSNDSSLVHFRNLSLDLGYNYEYVQCENIANLENKTSIIYVDPEKVIARLS